MSNPHGIIILGANGSGKTTLGRELARLLGFKHMDHDAYAFAESDIPYTNERSRDEQIRRMLADINKSRGFVLSAVTGDFGEEIESLFDLAVHIEAPLSLRIERIKQREIEKFGDRVLEGGDMYESQQKFLDFVASRPLSRIEQWAKTLACPVIRVDGTEDYKKMAADIANRYYTKPGEPWRVCAAAVGELSPYRFVVIFARYRGKWLYCRAISRDAWETAGGHIENGETPYEAAKRELYEETGAVPLEVIGVFDYSVHTETEFSAGRVFFAEIERLGELPDYEMAEAGLFDTIPDKMRFPQILPILYEQLQQHLNTQSCPDELWDVYDENRNPTGRIHRRGEPMQNGDYHLVVHVWLQNSGGEFLITQRAPEKHYPLMWECTGGSAVAGDDSLSAAIREVKEETGLDALPECGRVIIKQKRNHDFCDIWLFRQEFDMADVVLQKGETIDAKWASAQDIRKMIVAGDFVIFDYLDEFFEKAGV